jgi:hypothetical protein
MIVFTLTLSHSLVVNRQEALPEVVALLQDRIKQGRAFRTADCDVYLVPADRRKSGGIPTQRQCDKTIIDCALLFIPGALVESAVYANVAAKLSDRGVLVVVVNTEPYRMPSTLVDITEERITSIISYVNERYRIKEWAIGGHSMGTTAAACLVERLHMSKLIFWGTSVLKAVDLSKTNLQLLAVHASNDGYYTSKSERQLDQFHSVLPPGAGDEDLFPSKGRTTICMIQGGNHCGFGHYNPSTFYCKDGERSITLEEQHRQIVEVTSTFLLQPKSPKSEHKIE